MPKQTQAVIDAKMVEVRQLVEDFGKLQLENGRFERKKAEEIAVLIERKVFSIRNDIRALEFRLNDRPL